MFSYSDICRKRLKKLEQTLNGSKDGYKGWMNIIYDLYETTNEHPYRLAIIIYAKFMEIKNNFGQNIAKTLYDSQKVILAEELLEAAKYLKAGGPKEYLGELAEKGIFISLTPEQADLIVNHLKKGETLDTVYSVLDEYSDEQQNTQFFS